MYNIAYAKRTDVDIDDNGCFDATLDVFAELQTVDVSGFMDFDSKLIVHHSRNPGIYVSVDTKVHVIKTNANVDVENVVKTTANANSIKRRHQFQREHHIIKCVKTNGIIAINVIDKTSFGIIARAILTSNMVGLLM